MKLVVASSNAGKLLEFEEAFRDTEFELISATEAGINPFPEETGKTYQENALIKARHAVKETGLPALADDSGLEVEALDGAPGLYSARYGGLDTDGERFRHLLAKLESAPPGGRVARFVCSLVLVTPSDNIVAFEGIARGEITAIPHGKAGFGYDPIFFSHDLYKTFAEATTEEKQAVSHRGRALNALLDWLSMAEATSFFEA